MSSFVYPSQVNTGNQNTQAANTVLANVTASTAVPTAVSLVSTATASSVAIRDSSANLYVNNLISNFQTIVSAGGTTVLTAGSAPLIMITGSSAQTITMPVTSTLPQTGVPFYITNLSTGTVTVNSSDGSLLKSMMPGSSTYLFCASTGSNGSSAWNATLMPLPSVTAVNNTVSVRDSAGKGYFNNLRLSATATTASASTLTLTASSTQIQYISGSTAGYIVALPSTATLARGWTFYIVNACTQPVTVNGATGTFIVIVPTNGWVAVTCTSTSADGVGASGWISSNTNSAVVGCRARYYGSSSSLSGSLGTIVWDTADFTDALLPYSAGSFTCKAAGRVNVMASVMVTGTAALNNNVAIEVQKNTAVQNRRTLYFGAGITGITANIDGTVPVVVGDVLRIQVQSSLTSPTIVTSNTENYVSLVYV